MPSGREAATCSAWTCCVQWRGRPRWSRLFFAELATARGTNAALDRSVVELKAEFADRSDLEYRARHVADRMALVIQARAPGAACAQLRGGRILCDAARRRRSSSIRDSATRSGLRRHHRARHAADLTEPSVISLHHTHLMASDVDATIAFWRDHFGAEIVYDDDFCGCAQRVPEARAGAAPPVRAAAEARRGCRRASPGPGDRRAGRRRRALKGRRRPGDGRARVAGGRLRHG